MCGEKAAGVYPSAPAMGSPPRVRGKDVVAHAVHAVQRITPACAGKSGLPVSVVPRYQGSPPRVRGKVGAGQPARDGRRITPACAGKRQWGCQRCRAPRDHPRVCGEKSCTCPPAHRQRGSPPRVRGKAKLLFLAGNPLGITPACAGKRSRRTAGR